MRNAVLLRTGLIGFLLLGFLGAGSNLPAQTLSEAKQVRMTDLDREIQEFLNREITAHVADIKSLDPPPDRVVGALTIGEFSWGTFMRTLGVYSECFGTRTIAERDIPEMIGKMARIELSHGGKTWGQLYAAMALQSFGTDLNRNALWQSMASEEREAYRELLNPSRLYDQKTHTLIDLPENYFVVAAQIAES